MSEWQPIETAPKDEWVLVWSDEGLALTHWGSVYNKGSPRDGWVDYFHLDHGDVEFVIDPAPTHWMPTPGAPDEARWTLTDLGRAYRAVMQRGAKLNGEVKAGED